MPGKFLVLSDSREQKGWHFNKSKFCDGTETVTLPTGDYTIQGMEKHFTIERKGSSSEFYGNLFEDRWERELERLEEFKFPFVILEFSLSDIVNFPRGSSIPKYKWGKFRNKGPYFLRRFMQYQMKYKTKFILAGSKGHDAALCLFKRAFEQLV